MIKFFYVILFSFIFLYFIDSSIKLLDLGQLFWASFLCRSVGELLRTEQGQDGSLLTIIL